ncbi:MAG: ATP-binding cassette domain-containing protein [Rhodocyclaceae bacterium]|nr:ATP-binding cassette domain-containing protein [Rhodocyclaceae bacterium]
MAVRLQGVSAVHANGFAALKGIDLSVRRGERVAVIGPSGAGKTTLLRVLGLSLAPASGHCEVLGQQPWQVGARALRRLRSGIGHLHQAPPIPPRQRVVHAVLAGRLGQWSPWRGLASLLLPVDTAGAARELARLELEDRLFERCDRLSGGQLQRVALARVLYQRPELLLADEPVSAMDPALAELTVSLLADEARARDIALVASLHAVDLALRHFDRVVGVRDGGLAFDLPVAEVGSVELDALYAATSGRQREAARQIATARATPSAWTAQPLACR